MIKKKHFWLIHLSKYSFSLSPVYSYLHECVVLVCSGHTVRRVMWFRVPSEGRREFVHHTDPNQISLSYRGRTRYEKHSLILISLWLNVKICLRNGLRVPATLEAVIPAARYRFGLWSWAMQGTITSGLRRTSHWGDGPRLTLSGWMWQVAPRKLKPPHGLLQPVFLYMRNSQRVFRPPGSGASSTARQHVRLGRDSVCWLSGNRMRRSREEPRTVQVCLIHTTQLCYWKGWKNAADLLIKTPVYKKTLQQVRVMN